MAECEGGIPFMAMYSLIVVDEVSELEGWQSDHITPLCALYTRVLLFTPAVRPEARDSAAGVLGEAAKNAEYGG